MADAAGTQSGGRGNTRAPVTELSRIVNDVLATNEWLSNVVPAEYQLAPGARWMVPNHPAARAQERAKQGVAALLRSAGDYDSGTDDSSQSDDEAFQAPGAISVAGVGF